MLVKHKLMIVGGLALASMLMMMLIDNYKVNSITSFDEVRAEIADVRTGVLQLRRDEKDFLARNDLKYRDKFTENYTLLQEHFSELTSATRNVGLEQAKITEMGKHFQGYQEKFMALVAIQQTIGLNYEDGLYGGLREAVHNAEKMIAAADNQQLRADMLQLRRDEKDFMLRLLPKYVEKFEKNMGAFKKNLSTSGLPAGTQNDIAQRMDEYSKRFLALVDGTTKKGLDSNSGIRGEMREVIHQAETLLAEISVELDEAVKAKIGSVSRMSLITNALFVILIVAIIGIITWIGLTILKPLQALTDVITLAAESSQGSGTVL